MAGSAKGRLIRLIRQSKLGQDVPAFIIDRLPRGLSPRIVEFYANELSRWVAWTERHDLRSAQSITPEALRRYLRHRPDRSEEEPLWATVRASKLAYNGLWSIMRRRARLAGVATPSLHSFRRAFALTSLRNEVDAFGLQRLMGHADLTMLRRYLRQTRADLREAHRKAGPGRQHALGCSWPKG